MQENEKVVVFFVITTIVIVLLVVVFILLFVVFTSRKNKLLKEKIEDKYKNQLLLNNKELLALRSQMNPHFVYNSLNAIQYYIQRNNVEQAENYLSLFSRLIRRFFEFSRKEAILIEEEIEFINDYLKIEKLRFEEDFSFSILIDDKLDISDHNIPTMILQPLVENAVNHGVFHKKGKGMIRIDFTYINEYTFQVIIEDDGVGINAAKKLFKNLNTKIQSNSSIVLQERINLVNECKEWEIFFSIKDISELNTLKTGTIVKLLFKNLQHEN